MARQRKPEAPFDAWWRRRGREIAQRMLFPTECGTIKSVFVEIWEAARAAPESREETNESEEKS